MHFILFYDTVDEFTEKRAPFRALHLSKVREAVSRNELVIAGALGNPADGAILVFRGDSPEVAETFAKADPYVTQGLVKSWRVRQWNTVVGDGAEFPPL